jgi:hypothetical protein
MRMMFPIWALIWDSTKCDIKHGRDGYFRRDVIMVENVAGTFFAKKRRTETIVLKFAR